MLLKLDNLYIPIWGIVSLKKVDSAYEITYWAGEAGQPELRRIEVGGATAFELDGWISGQYVVQVPAAKAAAASRPAKASAKSQRTERLEGFDSKRQQAADRR